MISKVLFALAALSALAAVPAPNGAPLVLLAVLLLFGGGFALEEGR